MQQTAETQQLFIEPTAAVAGLFYFSSSWFLCARCLSVNGVLYQRSNSFANVLAVRLYLKKMQNEIIRRLSWLSPLKRVAPFLVVPEPSWYDLCTELRLSMPFVCILITPLFVFHYLVSTAFDPNVSCILESLVQHLCRHSNGQCEECNGKDVMAFSWHVA